MDKIELTIQPREVMGKKVEHLRKSGLIPGVLYGHGFNSMPVQVDAKNFKKVYSEAGESALIYLRLNGQEHPIIIHDVALDPLSDEPSHVDFYKVRLDEKVEAEIELVFIGEAPAVKNFGGILIKNLSHLNVKGLPGDLPSEIEVDISGLNKIEDQIAIHDLKISSKLEIKAKPDELIAIVQAPISEEEFQASLEATSPAAEDVEVIKKAPLTEDGDGGEPAEQAASPSAEKEGD